LVNSNTFNETETIKFKIKFDDKSLAAIVWIVRGLSERFKTDVTIKKINDGKKLIVELSDPVVGVFFKNDGVFFEIENDDESIEKNYFDIDMLEKTLDSLARKVIIDRSMIEVVNKKTGTVEIYKNIPFDFNCILTEKRDNGDFSVKINDFNNTIFEFADDVFQIYAEKMELKTKIDYLKKIFK